MSRGRYSRRIEKQYNNHTTEREALRPPPYCWKKRNQLNAFEVKTKKLASDRGEGGAQTGGGVYMTSECSSVKDCPRGYRKRFGLKSSEITVKRRIPHKKKEMEMRPSHRRREKQEWHTGGVCVFRFLF